MLIALMMSVLVGFVALSIDAGRAFGARRALQDGVDAAALAAADFYQTGAPARSWSLAQQKGISLFQRDSALYNPAFSCTPTLASAVPVGGKLSSTCDVGGGYILTIAVSDAGIEGQRFSFAGSRTLPVALIQVLGQSSDLTILASATAVVGDQGTTPAIAALGSSGCFGSSGNALAFDYANTLTVVGSVTSNGSINVTSGSVVNVAGDLLGRCGGPGPGTVAPYCWSSGPPPAGYSPPCAAGDSKGRVLTPASYADPRYSTPVVGPAAPLVPGSTVEVLPGSYSGPINFNAQCYFLAGGVYQFAAGYSVSSGIVSNELRPPGAPQFDNNTLPEPKPFWNDNGAKCDGDYKASTYTVVSPLQPIKAASYSVVLTSGRNDNYLGQPFERESAPSICHPSVDLDGTTQGLRVNVSNVPGAQWYNVYLQKGGTSCTGPFGWVGKIPVGMSPAPANNATGTCPDVLGTASPHCSLQLATGSFSKAEVPDTFTPVASQLPRMPGAYPPSGLQKPYVGVNPYPNQTPARSTQWALDHAGDRANENQCAAATGTQVECPAAVTPGAVELYATGNSCTNVADPGDAYLFSGYQYNWLLNYVSGTASCTIDGQTNAAEIGMTYAPLATMNFIGTSEFASPYFGGLVAGQIFIQGASGQPAMVIPFNSAYAPAPPAARLSG